MTTHYFKNGNYYSFTLLRMLVFACMLLQVADGYAQRRYNARKENSSIALGANTSYQIINGKLWAWGANNYGQFGNGTTTGSYVPVQIGTDTDWMSITAGNDFAIALKANGTLWSWGHNTSSGQLGDGTTTDRSTPQQVATDTWLHIAAGSLHTAAIKSDGTLWTWGINSNGQLGVSTISYSSYSRVPAQVNTDKWIYISAAGDNTFGIKANGTLYGWGVSDDYHNQLNYSTGGQTRSGVPLLIDAGPWLNVANGFACGVGIKADGSIWSWGFVTGDGNSSVRYSLVNIGTDTWSNVAMGYDNNTYAIKTDGTLWSWGNNFPGSVGDGGTSPRTTPYQISSDAWVTVAGAGTAWRAAAIKADGTLWTWGDSASGANGDGTNTVRLSPVNVSTGTSLDSWQVITSGYYHSAGIKSDGTLWTWGLNQYGPLGDGATIDRNCPIQIGTSKWISVSAGLQHTLGIKADGTLWAWGYNGYAQLGDGTYINQNVPKQIGTDRWVTVSAGYTHSVAIRSDGKLFTWGYNQYGQLGDNSTTDRSTPTQIGTATWVGVVAGTYHTAGIQSDGSLWTFGYNGAGILGDGTTTDRHAPIKISGTDTWVRLSAGNHHTHAIKSDGSLYSWGYNAYGHLGDGSTTSRNTPVLIASGNTWRFISASKYAGGAAIKSNGTLWGWGMNEYGQIGDATNDQRTSPVSIADVLQYKDEVGETVALPQPIQINNNNWIMVAAGYQSTMAIKPERTLLYSTGTNSYGQMGRNVVAFNTYGINKTGSYNTYPVDLSSGNNIICTGHSTTLSAGAIGGTLAWYGNASGGSQLWLGASYSTTALTSNITYYVQSTAYCTTPNVRTAVPVTVNSCARLTEEGELTYSGDLRAFPNPNTGSFTLMGNKEGIYTIVNQLGETVQSVELTNANSYTVEINQINKGVYSVVGPDRTSQRIVVLK